MSKQDDIVLAAEPSLVVDVVKNLLDSVPDVAATDAIPFAQSEPLMIEPVQNPIKDLVDVSAAKVTRTEVLNGAYIASVLMLSLIALAYTLSVTRRGNELTTSFQKYLQSSNTNA